MESAAPLGKIWTKRFNEFKAWVEANKRNPQKYAKDPTERVLGNWRQAQQDAERKGVLPWTSSRRQALDDIAPNWRGEGRDRSKTWEDRAHELKAWVDANGRLPHYPTNDVTEKQLNFWLINQRNSKAGNNTSIWSKEREETLNRLVPTWENRTPHEKWEDRLKDLIQFEKEHGRLPRSPKKKNHDLDVFESTLSRWVDNQRQASQGTGQRPLSPEREKALDNAVPGWRGRVYAKQMADAKKAQKK